MSPLRKGSSKKVIGENISTMMREGRKQPQAVAIAMDMAHRGLGMKQDMPAKKKQVKKGKGK